MSETKEYREYEEYKEYNEESLYSLSTLISFHSPFLMSWSHKYCCATMVRFVP